MTFSLSCDLPVPPHPLTFLQTACYSSPFVIRLLPLSFMLLLYMHLSSPSFSIAPLAALPPTQGSWPHCSPWTFPTIIFSSFQQMTGYRLGVADARWFQFKAAALSDGVLAFFVTFSHASRWWLVPIPFIKLGMAERRRRVSFSQRWYQRELWRREGVHR